LLVGLLVGLLVESTTAQAPSWSQTSYDWKQANQASVKGPTNNGTVKELFLPSTGTVLGVGPLISPLNRDVIFTQQDTIISINPSTGKITWTYTLPLRTDDIEINGLGMDNEGNLYALVYLNGRDFFFISNDQQLQGNITLGPIDSGLSPLSYIVSPSGQLLVFNQTTNGKYPFSGQTCYISDWTNSPSLTNCADGWPLAMNDAGVLFTLNTSTPTSITLNAYNPLSSKPLWTQSISSSYKSFFATVWEDENLVLLAFSYTDTLYALNMMTGEIVWKFTFSYYPSGISVSPKGVIYLYAGNVDMINALGFYQGTLNNIGGPIAVDSKGNYYGERNNLIEAFDPNHNSLWTYIPRYYTTNPIAIGANNALFVLTPINLISIQN